MNFQRESRADKIVKDAIKYVRADWGPTAYERLGNLLQTALVTQRVMIVLSLQDEAIASDRIRELLNDTTELIHDYFEGRL